MSSFTIAFFGSAPIVKSILNDINNSQDLTLSQLALNQFEILDPKTRESIKVSEEELKSEVLQKKIDLKLVVTQPDRMNRKKLVRNTIAQYAINNNIELYQPARIKYELDTYAEFDSMDIGIVAAYGQILPMDLIESHTYGMINWHPSKLPELRGPTPIQATLLSGLKKSALSWIDVAKDMDAGDIYLQQEVEIDPEENFTSLANRFSEFGSQQWALAVALKVLDKEMLTVDYAPKRQKFADVTFCKMIRKEDKIIKPDELSAAQIKNHVRAYDAFPGTVYHSKYFNQDIKLKTVGSVVTGNEFKKMVSESSSMGVFKELKVLGTNEGQKTFLKTNDGLIELKEVILTSGKQINLKGYQF